ncbi:MAG: TatD family hydrolase [Planctomycetota bacterium]|jgi:TatD DNase family protein
MIDTHCHLTFEQFAGRVDQVLADARQAGVRGVITVGTTPADCLQAQDLASRYEHVWCTAGIHPLSADEPRSWGMIEKVARHPRCVAWGELGLDNHYHEPSRSVQEALLHEQLAFIESCSGPDAAEPKPIVVHCRQAVDDLLSVFRAAPFDPARYVFHCFTGTPEDARKVLDFGAWISFTGVVTFSNAREVAEAARLVPLDRIMVETDAPFLSPEPVRNVRPNEPKHVMHIARFLADLRGADPVELEYRLDANAERFFGITLPSKGEPEAAR